MGSGLFGRLERELDAREKTPGLSMSDILALPENLRRLVNWMMRQRYVELDAAAAHVGQDAETVRSLLADMIEKGFVTEFEMRGTTYYRVRLAPKRGREIPLDIWECLDEKCEQK